jgi:hypothetical protein
MTTYIDIYVAFSGNDLLCCDCADKRGVVASYHTLVSGKGVHWFCDECGVEVGDSDSEYVVSD